MRQLQIEELLASRLIFCRFSALSQLYVLAQILVTLRLQSDEQLDHEHGEVRNLEALIQRCLLLLLLLVLVGHFDLSACLLSLKLEYLHALASLLELTCDSLQLSISGAQAGFTFAAIPLQFLFQFILNLVVVILLLKSLHQLCYALISFRQLKFKLINSFAQLLLHDR